MKKIILIVFTLFLTLGCSRPVVESTIDVSNINRIDLEIYEYPHNIIPNDTVRYTITDKDDIDKIVGLINDCRTEPVKFMPKSRMTLFYDNNKQKVILLNNNHLKIDGETYVSNKDIINALSLDGTMGKWSQMKFKKELVLLCDSLGVELPDDISLEGNNPSYIKEAINYYKIYNNKWKNPKESILSLINSFNDNERLTVMFLNPYSSTIDIESNGVPVTISKAYIIEYILSKDSAPKLNLEMFRGQYGTDNSAWNKIIGQYKIYPYGRVYKMDGNTKQKKLTKDDLLVIQKMYRDWWQNYKNLDINEIRKEYRQNKILQPPYYWE